jgi:hypothetical protein
MVREDELKSIRPRDPETDPGDLPPGDGGTTSKKDKRGPFTPGGRSGFPSRFGEAERTVVGLTDAFRTRNQEPENR